MGIKEPTEENKKLITSERLNPDRWFVIWEDYEVLELINRRGHRRTIRKTNCQ